MPRPGLAVGPSVWCAAGVPDRSSAEPASAPRARWLGDAVADLLTGSRCVGCDVAGALLCPGCRSGLPVRAVRAAPDPRPPGLPQVWSAGPHHGVLRALVVGHKEEAHLALRPPLAELLALAVADGARAAALDGRVLLCPVPSRPGAARRRGHDPLRAVVRLAARSLRRAGHDVHAVELLRPGAGARGVRDQGDLGAVERAANVAGTLTVPSPVLARVGRRHRAAWVVVCDDVVTTGSTLVEAARALGAVGLPVPFAATVTATPRRRPAPLSKPPAEPPSEQPSEPSSEVTRLFARDSRARSLPPVGPTH